MPATGRQKRLPIESRGGNIDVHAKAPDEGPPPSPERGADIERLIQRWAQDAEFRAAVRNDPAQAISNAGFQRNDTERGASEEADCTLPESTLRSGRVAGVSASPPA